MSRRAGALLLLCLLLPAMPSIAREVAADSLVPAELLQGPGWQVERRAEIRGYQARFVIHTDWGTLHADSVELLALRVAEMPALRLLHDEAVTEALADAGGNALLKPAGAMGRIARQPLRTLGGLPAGVARYFGERWQRLGEGGRRLADRSWSAIAEDGSPFEEVDGPLGEAGFRPQRAPAGWWARRGNELGSLVKHEAGFHAARQRLAERLGVDPWTGNELIRTRLDQLAWAEASGNWATGQALALLAGPAAAAIGHAVTVDRMVLQTPPEDLKAVLLERLAAHCRDESLMRRFLRDSAFSPSLQASLIDHFETLGPASGCDALLETALMADNEAQARFVLGSLRLLLHYLGPASEGGQLRPLGALIVYETRSGELVLPLAVDWLDWSGRTRRWFDLPALGRHADRSLLLSGNASPMAQRALTRRGWSLVQRLPYPGAPPYLRLLP